MSGDTEREKLYDRILKLHRKAESAKKIGSEAEAMIFADAVQRLLIANELELTDLEYREQQKDDPIKLHFVRLRRQKRRTLWAEVIARACAEAHLCGIIGMEGDGGGICLIGRRQHRLVAEFMILTLIRLAEQVANREYTTFYYQCKAAGDVKAARGYRSAFLLGFAGRVAARYKHFSLETRQQVKDSKALIRLSTEKDLVAQVLNTLREEGAVSDQEEQSPNLANAHGLGLLHGADAGGRVPLRANVVAAPAHQAAMKALPPGQKILEGGSRG